MDNVEFVKAYEQWKNSEALDRSPERFAEWMNLREMNARVEYLEHLWITEGDNGLGYAREILSGEYDGDMDLWNGGVTND